MGSDRKIEDPEDHTGSQSPLSPRTLCMLVTSCILISDVT